MNWERVESARFRARLMLAIPWVALGFLWVAAPSFTPQIWGGSNRAQQPDLLGIPFSSLPMVVGIFGLVIGYVWMWKLYRAPTRYEGAHWRFHDH
jgi:hypothetical protein